MKQNTAEMLTEWACSAWDMILRIVWLSLFAAATIGALRLMAEADKGRQEPTQERL
jgi:hypothetical protein